VVIQDATYYAKDGFLGGSWVRAVREEPPGVHPMPGIDPDARETRQTRLIVSVPLGVNDKVQVCGPASPGDQRIGPGRVAMAEVHVHRPVSMVLAVIMDGTVVGSSL